MWDLTSPLTHTVNDVHCVMAHVLEEQTAEDNMPAEQNMSVHDSSVSINTASVIHDMSKWHQACYHIDR